MKKILLLFFLLPTLLIYGQENIYKDDIKVGVVLSGGGAKGFSHVAFLKVLEEAGVRVDYIGGTSMGAVVAALYASGYSPTQLDSIIHSIDFYKILSNEIPRKAKPFYEKESGEKYALTFPIKNNKIGIPTAISEGQNVLNLLTQLTQHVNHINDFSKLPIPFICIATDLETGKQELLNKGFLPEAVKASASFPTLLSPVEIDGKLLSDGGIVNNFPVDEVKNMGADIIIGVDIQSGLEDKEHLDSALKIINQIVGFQMYQTLETKYKKVDLLIKPDLKEYNVISFDKIEKILEEGEKSTREKFNELQKIASLQKNKKKRIEITEAKKLHVTHIDVDGNNHYTRAYIRGKLNLKRKDRITYKTLIEGINNLTATGNFSSVQYQIKGAKNMDTISVKVKESDISNLLQIGAHYDDLYKTGVLFNTTLKHVLNKNDILSADFILGDNLRYNFNYFVDNGFYWSYGFRSRYNTFDSNVNFDEANVNKINIVYEDFTNQVYLQTVFNRKFAVGAGFEFQRIKAFTETISSVENNPNSLSDRLYFDRSNYLNTLAYIKIDTYDKKYFQKEGFFLNADFKWYLSSSDFTNTFEPFSQLKGKLGIAHTFFKRITAHLISEAGITIGENTNRVLDYNVGGYGENFINNFIPFYGYDFAELTANSFLRSTLTLRTEIMPKNYFSATANFTRVENDLFNEGRIFENTKTGYMVGYGIDTFLGPIEINYAWSPDTNSSYWYFNVGYWF